MTRACSLVVLLLAIAGCGSASSAQSTVRPTVRIISPVNGAKLPSETVAIHLAISHFTLTSGGTGQKTGTGQAWFYVDGHLKIGGSTTVATLSLAPGTYTLKAALVTNGKAVAVSAPATVSVVVGTIVTKLCATSPINSTPTGAQALKSGTISLFAQGLPPCSSVSDLTPAPGGSLWFIDCQVLNTGIWRGNCAPGKSTIGRIMPSGAISLFDKGLPANSSFLTDLTAGPGGNLWFVDCVGPMTCPTVGSGVIGRITPTGLITVFSKGLPAGAGDYVSWLLEGADGDLWFTVHSDGVGTDAIVGFGRISASGVITMFHQGLPAGTTRTGLVAGPGGDLWFRALVGGSVGIGRLSPTGTVTIFSQGLPPNSEVGHLRQGPDGNLWFPTCIRSSPSGSQACLAGTDAIARVTASGAITLYHVNVPAGTQVVDLTPAPGNGLWFETAPNDPCGYIPGAAPCPSGTAIGHITTSGAVTLFTHGLPANGALGSPYVAPNGDMWFTSCANFTAFQCDGAASIGRITPSGGLDLYSTGLSADLFLYWALTATPNGALWFNAQRLSQGVQSAAIGRLSASGHLELFDHGLPSGAWVSNLVAGSHGYLWFTASDPNQTYTVAIGRISQ